MRRLIGLVLLCFVVGIVLAALGVTPRTLYADTWNAIRSAYDLAARLIDWALPYILLGALVVVPLAVVGFVIRLARGRG